MEKLINQVLNNLLLEFTVHSNDRDFRKRNLCIR